MITSLDSAFIPLTNATVGSQPRLDFRVSVISQAQNVQPFRPGMMTNATAAPKIHAPGCEPTVSVQREGERISSIRVQCSCGQIIELSCVY